ncbi:hypothetical protein J1605_019776 [Eschrichtius robustus]|uniref:uDENN domain-containing protein n=1 Tax=Eschrichtius robustus TaxID=9764 RepID=A0AB34HI55_ESCRO|nr:hypothetical protein J1605_019776 [Eschrichtius robustus]
MEPGGKCPKASGDMEVLQTLTKFCFPFYVDSLTVSQVGQNFTFVLTDIDSKQRFGFCRLSSGAKSCFCILSSGQDSREAPLTKPGSPGLGLGIRGQTLYEFQKG